MKDRKLLCTTAIPLLGSDNPNGNANSANNIPNPIDTIIKSINHATNLSVQLDKITSTGRLFPDPVLDLGGEKLFDDSTLIRIVWACMLFSYFFLIGPQGMYH